MENLQSTAACQLYFLSKVFAAHKTNLITTRARKIKRSSRLFANARKDHSMPPNIILVTAFRALYLENFSLIFSSLSFAINIRVIR